MDTNVLTAIRKVEKVIPGFETSYMLLSEAAHPNWCGTQGAYGTINHETAVVDFSRTGMMRAGDATRDVRWQAL